MAYNPYYVQPQYPTYNQGYYSTEKINNFYQSMPNQNSFSTGGSFQQQAPQQQQSFGGGGDTMNKVGAVAQGVGEIAGYMQESGAKVKSINPNVNTIEYDPYGRPIYNLGADQQRFLQTDPNQAGKGVVGKSTIAGAKAGSTFGPIGTAVGAFAGAVAGAFTRNINIARAKRRKKKMESNLLGAQNRYNQANVDYTQSTLSRQAYEDQLRNNNPYGFPSTYY